MEPASTVPRATVIIAVISSGMHFLYLLSSFFHRLYKRGSRNFLSDDETFHLLHTFVYATVKLVIDAVVMALSSSLDKWLSLLVGLSIGTAMTVEVSRFLSLWTFLTRCRLRFEPKETERGQNRGELWSNGSRQFSEIFS